LKVGLIATSSSYIPCICDASIGIGIAGVDPHGLLLPQLVRADAYDADLYDPVFDEIHSRRSQYQILPGAALRFN
jgi:hypothetical protein